MLQKMFKKYVGNMKEMMLSATLCANLTLSFTCVESDDSDRSQRSTFNV